VKIQIGERTYPVARYLVHASRIGGWTADVEIAANDVAPGPCVLGGWRGTVRTVNVNGSLAVLDVRAGDDALDAATTSRHWAATMPASTVIGTLAAEAGTTAVAAGSLASWRAYGGTLRAELVRLAQWLAAGSWYVDEASGSVVVGQRAGGALDAPGRYTGAGGVWRAYAVAPEADLAVLVGGTVDGVAVERACYAWTGQGTPVAELYAPEATATRSVGAIMGGTVEAETDSRATIVLDDGTRLGDVPLYFMPGVRAVVPAGCRVLVADLGGDPRAPVAFCAPFDSVPAGDLGQALRVGDVIMFPVSPNAVPTPQPIELAPSVSGYGPPGSGGSRVLL
jgi:hypothetical protein